MNRKYVSCIAAVLMISMLLCACSRGIKPIPIEDHGDDMFDESFLSGMWVSYIEIKRMSAGGTKASFEAETKKLISECEEWGISDIFFHVRPFGDAVYPSKLFPWSHVLSGTQGESIDFDPLEIFINTVHKKGIKVHGWINPYRLSLDKDFKFSSNNALINWTKNEKEKSAISCVNGGYYIVPTDDRGINYVVSGIEELLLLYPKLDGIHMDDYFFPTTDSSFDKTQYEEYKKSGGNKQLADFRREKVSELIKKTYDVKEKINPNVRFGISPQGNPENNYNGLYADVELWMREKGYIDYVCPQIYWGFSHEKVPFEKMVTRWSGFEKHEDMDLYIGITAGKLGENDSYAGVGKDEWINSSDILAHMIKCSKEKNTDGVVVFRYDLLANPSENKKVRVSKELKSFIEQIKDRRTI